MALIEKTTIDKIEILENGSIQVRQANIIERDGTVVAKTFHRHVLKPGDDLSNEDPKVVAVANTVWTQEVIDAWQNSVSQEELP